MNKEHDRGSCVDGVGADGVSQLVEDRSEAQSEGNKNENVLQVVPSKTFFQVQENFENLKFKLKLSTGKI